MTDKTTLSIRYAQTADLTLLAEYWYDYLAVQSQKQRTISLMPDAQQQWIHYIQTLLTNNESVGLVAEREGECAGAIFGQIITNEPGLLPKHIGHLDTLVVDMHSPYKRNNIITMLLDALKAEWIAKGITLMQIRVPAYAPVEQSFWRGLGASHTQDTFWITL
ncbi:MAG: GNAT family N-acetyltransferase [Chloroflexota bacterium]